MPLTAPGSISNSGSKPFSNLFGRIAIDNYNIIEESNYAYNYYTNKKSNKTNETKNLPKTKYLPKTVNEVLISTGLIY